MNPIRRSVLLLLVSFFGVSTSLASSSASKATGGTGVHVPVGKDGDGFYSASTKGCFDVIDNATPLILEQIQKQIDSDKNDDAAAYHIADFGTADGGTSLGLLTKMVQAIRSKTKQQNREVVLHYEDQVTNEWQSVFKHSLGLSSVKNAYGNTIPTPYELGNVYVDATGIGFHNQCYPTASIDFGISFTAMHWLSEVPNSFKGKDYMHAARRPKDDTTSLPKEKEIAADDWYNILKSRSKELKVGGKFVCVNFCITEEGYFLGQTDVGASMWDSFQTAWNLLSEKKLIDEDERTGVSFPSYYRTTDEFVSTITETDLNDELTILSVEERITPCPYRELYTKQKSSMSAREYAESFVPTTRTWSDSTFRNALRSDRTEDDKDLIINQFWENYISLVEQNPAEHGMDYAHTYLVLEKKDSNKSTNDDDEL
mmetsp:Transcript_41952/g.47678  ORF Transcript_41952/g.47678 Transcript_41952/m.47678 type:complete len:428 (+) Transcript_41952:57-1340(+)